LLKEQFKIMAKTIEERQNQGISESWSLRDFRNMKGKMQIGKFAKADETTGEVREFTSCVFTDPNNPNQQTNKTFVAFSSKLGTMSAKEIVNDVDNLQVVKLQESGSFVLCKKGANTWEDVDF
jgi:hypothetical protein